MKHFALLIALFGCLSISAQNSLLEEGDYYFDKFNFPEAMQFYLEAYQGDSVNPYIARHIGLCMRKLGMLEGSAQYFFKAIELTADTPEDMLHYAEALKSKADYAKAIFWYAQYAAERPDDRRAQKHILDTRYFQDLWADSLKYSIKRLAINSDKPSFGMCKFNEKYIFSSAGIRTSSLQQATQEEIPYLDVYSCTLNDEGEAMNAELIEGNVNSTYHDGPAFFDATRNTMFVTRNNIKRGKPVYDQSGTANLKVYSMAFIADSWAKAQDLPFNSDDFSVGHPCVNDAGDLMVFVSNMPGGFGGTDLYKVEMQGDEWGQPENLGPIINTEGNEMFPFISPQGYLYFSSDGHAGLGGLDIFVSESSMYGFSEPNNIGFPINSPQDDFSIFYDENAEAGYFSTNRGSVDNIYRFDVVNFVQQIVAMTFENENGNDLAGKNVTLRWLEAQTDSTIILDETGSMQVLVEKGNNFEVYLGNGASRSSEPIARFSTDEVLQDTYINLGKVSISKEVLENHENLDKVKELIALTLENEYGVDLAGKSITLTSVDEQTESILVLDESASFEVAVEKDNTFEIYLGSGTSKSKEPIATFKTDNTLEDFFVKNGAINVNEEALREAGYLEKLTELIALTLKNDYGVDLAGENITLTWVDEQTDTILELDESASFEVAVAKDNNFEIYLGSGKSRSKEPIATFTTDNEMKDSLIEEGVVQVSRDALEEAGYLEKLAQLIAITLENEYGVDLAGEKITLTHLEAQTDSILSLDEKSSFEILAEKNNNFEVYLGDGDSRSDEPIVTLSTNELLDDAFINMGNVKVSREALQDAGYLEQVAQLIAATMEDDSLGMAQAGENIRQMLTRLRDETNFLSSTEFDELTSSELLDDSELQRVVAVQTEELKEKNQQLKEFKLNNIYFGFDKFDIQSSEKQKVEALMKILNEDSSVNVVIKAHADSRGNDDYNLLLSMRRAQSIQKHLEKQGIDPSRFQIAWVGEKEPLVNCANQGCSEEDHAQNRRAEILFVSGQMVSNE